MCASDGVDTADPPADLANLKTFTAVRGSVTDAGTWRRAIAALTADAADGVVSLGYVGAAAVLDVGVLAHEDMAVWQRTWEVNVLGNVLALRELLPLLTSAEYAAVWPSAASTGVRRATAGRLLILEGRVDQRRAHDRTRLCPSWGEGQHPGPRAMRAGLFERHLASATDPARFLATREARQPIGRLPGADEVAQAAAFLLWSAASALFASTLTADGGLTASFDFRTGEEGSSA